MEMTSEQQKAYLEMDRLYKEIVEQARRHPQDEYWQGKKDGIRTSFIFLCESMGFDERADSLQGLAESSPLASRGTDWEKVRALAKDAMYCIGEALWMDEDKEPLHPLSRVNWKRWVDWYKHLAKDGLVPEVTDSCWRG